MTLLGKTGCTRVVCSSELASFAAPLQESKADAHFKQLETLENLLTASEVDYVYHAHYEDVVDDPMLILHSSGSTGTPKIVTFTHGTICTLDVRDYGNIDGRMNHDAITTLRFTGDGCCAYDMFPPFHLAGVNMKIFVPIYNLTAAIFGPSSRPPTGVLAAQIMKVHRPSGACLPPSIIEQLFHVDGSDEIFKTLEILVFTGGPLSKAIGDHICKFTRVAQQYGSTEMGSIRQLLPAREDWQWIEFHPSERLEMQPFEDGLSELVLFSSKELEGTSWLYHTFPDVTEWRSRDLFEQNPANPVLWRFFGRVDDILVFSSGEKLFPVPMESALDALHEVKGALVVGSGFPQSALLVEVADGVDLSYTASQKFWEEVEKVNTLLPTHGRITRSMIITASPDKPFPRAAKGTIIRRQTERLYAKEIEQSLDGTQASIEEPISLRPSLFQLTDVVSLVQAIISRVSIVVQVTNDENLYESGLDSVKTAEALGDLKKSLSPFKSAAELQQLSLEFMYLNSTIKKLASALLVFVNEGRLPHTDRVKEMKDRIQQYTRKITHIQADGHTTNGISRQKFNIGITGTTGFFGSYILRELMKNPNVSHIYCLDRSPNLHHQFEGQQADGPLLHHFQTDFTADRLGVFAMQYEDLIENCDLYIHNAWQVDFNQPLSYFEPSLQSVEQLVQMTAKSLVHARILFISSTSTTGDFADQGCPPEIIPEDVLEDLNKSMKIGYGESKMVAEHILKNAAIAGIPVMILRVGSLAPRAGDP